uniref:Uncharacterized protein n=1 Tax=Tetranychus urticae TaxID=32264 RepID=T1K825_TETUR
MNIQINYKLYSYSFEFQQKTQRTSKGAKAKIDLVEKDTNNDNHINIITITQWLNED